MRPILLICGTAASALAQRGAAPPRGDSGLYGALNYRFVGPPGNRVIAVAGIAGDPLTYYIGAASGGIWKTTDGGSHWTPIFDGQKVASIGALAVAPSDSNTVWAGTGETFIRSHISMGAGVFKSTDAGATWQKMGLEATARIARIAVDPRNANVVLLAALGHAYGPQPDRGIYRTADGGATWSRTLFPGDSAGGIDVLLDPNDPNVVYAATWQVEIHTWGRTSGGDASGIWKSIDNGVRWRRLTGNGLPTHPFGKVGLGVTRADSRRVYALIETGKGIPWKGAPTDTGTLWRSDDAGEHWRLVNSHSELLARPAYYTRMGVEPDSADEAYFLSIGFSSTHDGGRSLDGRSTAQSPGFDNHDIWIDPTNGNRIIVANDEGVSISVTRGRSWRRMRLPIAQMYHATTDKRIPYTICGNMQDGPSTCGPSNSKAAESVITGGAEIPRGMWYSVGGGESGWATPDPVDPNIVWSTSSGRGSVGGIVVRYDVAARRARDVEVWPVSTAGHAAKDVKYRFVWDFPITISPHDHNRIYVGSQFVHMTTNGGQSWQLISPDLTRNDKSRQQHSGGLTGDNIGVEYGNVIYAIAESPIVRGLIWAGTNDGLVQLTRDGGKTWMNVTANIPGIIPWGTISNIEPSHTNPGMAYITVNGHQEGRFEAQVFKTSDYGRSWTSIVDGIAPGPLSFARCVREDPFKSGLLFLGTENALYVSFNDGGRWEPLQLNLPHAPVSWITVQPHFHDLVVATYGRGFYVLDDVTSLEQLTSAVRQEPVHLFAPRSAYRFRLTESIREDSDDPSAGRNPAYGASIDYWLGVGANIDSSITITDSTGKVVRTLAAPHVAGLNRVVWDLRIPLVEQRSAPFGASGNIALLAPPGRYLVHLKSGTRELTQSLAVLKDPDSGGSARELAQQTSMVVAVANDAKRAIQLSNEITLARTQLRELGQRNDAEAVRLTADSLIAGAASIADSLVQRYPVAFYERPVKLIAKLAYLASEVSSSDRRPTDQARAAHAFLQSQLRLVEREWTAFKSGRLAQFNAVLQSRKLPVILGTQP